MITLNTSQELAEAAAFGQMIQLHVQIAWNKKTDKYKNVRDVKPPPACCCASECSQFQIYLSF